MSSYSIPVSPFHAVFPSIVHSIYFGLWTLWINICKTAIPALYRTLLSLSSTAPPPSLHWQCNNADSARCQLCRTSLSLPLWNRFWGVLFMCFYEMTLVQHSRSPQYLGEVATVMTLWGPYRQGKPWLTHITLQVKQTQIFGQHLRIKFPINKLLAYIYLYTHIYTDKAIPLYL